MPSGNADHACGCWLVSQASTVAEGVVPPSV
jgi:hypothetical protein